MVSRVDEGVGSIEPLLTVDFPRSLSGRRDLKRKSQMREGGREAVGLGREGQNVRCCLLSAQAKTPHTAPCLSRKQHGNEGEGRGAPEVRLHLFSCPCLHQARSGNGDTQEAPPAGAHLACSLKEISMASARVSFRPPAVEDEEVR